MGRSLFPSVAFSEVEGFLRYSKMTLPESTLRNSSSSGTGNVNEIPGHRLELSPFGGVKDSGLGIKEGVIEAMKFMTTVKTFSLPW